MADAAMDQMAGQSRAEILMRGVRDNRIYANESEVWALNAAILWLEEVATEPPADADRSLIFIMPVPVGADGAPEVDESDIAEFAVATQMTRHAARGYLADAADLRWRLPRLRAAMQAQDVPVWRARQIASATHGLCAEAAREVDRALVGIAAKTGAVTLARLILEAEARFDPVAAQERADAAAEQRKVSAFPSMTGTGTVEVVATLDHGDASDLEAAIAMVAAELADEARAKGEEQVESLDVRRSRALGMIARRQLAGQLDASGQMTTRVLHAYVHLTEGSSLARVEKGDQPIPVSTVAEWCSKSNTSVRVTPVLDLNRPLARDGYVPSRPLREQVIVRDDTCVHPYCRRRARVCDLDYIHAYRSGGPPGQTSSSNLAPLWRHHHRLTTHAG